MHRHKVVVVLGPMVCHLHSGQFSYLVPEAGKIFISKV